MAQTNNIWKKILPDLVNYPSDRKTNYFLNKELEKEPISKDKEEVIKRTIDFHMKYTTETIVPCRIIKNFNLFGYSFYKKRCEYEDDHREFISNQWIFSKCKIKKYNYSSDEYF